MENQYSEYLGLVHKRGRYGYQKGGIYNNSLNLFYNTPVKTIVINEAIIVVMAGFMTKKIDAKNKYLQCHL